jgi:hypothetical protein
MPSTPRRLGAALAGATLAISACASGGHVAAPGHPSGPATTPSTVTSVTEPTVDVAKLRPILLGATDLLPGFQVAPASETGDDSTSLRPCGQPLVATGPSVAQIRAVFDRNGGQEQVVEVVEGFNGVNAAAHVAQLRQVLAGCRQFDSVSNGKTVTLLVTPVQPPAVGEDVIGVQLASSARFSDAIIVRSGQIEAIVFVNEVGNTVPTATMQAVVTAAGTKLAAGTGG